MTEFVGLAYFAEIPVVIIDVQRMGPSTGLPTRTSQGDILKLHLLGHGDCRHIVLIPGSVERVLRDDRRGARPRPAVPDARLRRHRPRPGHEPLAHRARSSTPTKPLERGKVLDRGRPRAAGPASSATGTSTATASATGRSPAPRTRWPPTSPAAPATTRSRATASAPRTGRRTSTAWR